MTDAEVIEAIRANHLKANMDTIAMAEQEGGRAAWERAWLDPGGTIFGSGPYLKVPIDGGAWNGTSHRVYPPARLRRQLAKQWKHVPVVPAPPEAR